MCDRHEDVEDDKGPWYVSEVMANGFPKIVIQSDDFAHDVALEVTGDFACIAQRKEYAEKLAARMNAMPGVRSLDWRKR